MYRDFFFELIEQISQVGGFTANLQTLPEQVGYGGQIGETQPKGLIGEIYNNVSVQALDLVHFIFVTILNYQSLFHMCIGESILAIRFRCL